MLFNWFDFIVLFGILQGIITCLILVFQKIDQPHRKLIVGLILVLCILSFKIEIHTLRLWEKPLLRYFPLGIDLLIQPLLFLYVCSLTRPNFEFRPNQMIHFLAPGLFFSYSVLVYLAVLPTIDLHQKDVIAADWYFNEIKNFEDLLSVGSAFVYGYFCFSYINKYQEWLHQFTSDTRYHTLSWLKDLLVVTALLGFALFVNLLLDYTSPHSLSFYRWQFFYLYLSFLIYYLG